MTVARARPASGAGTRRVVTLHVIFVPMRFFTSLLLATAICAWHIPSAGAQQRLRSAWDTSALPPVALVSAPISTDSSRRASGLVGATAGAGLGTFAGLLLFVPMALEASCHPRGAELSCYTPFVPLVLGSSVGASLGSTIQGGESAFRPTLLGSVIATGVSVAAVVGARQTSGRSSLLWLAVPPAVGAIVGNQVGQKR